MRMVYYLLILSELEHNVFWFYISMNDTTMFIYIHKSFQDLFSESLNQRYRYRFILGFRLFDTFYSWYWITSKRVGPSISKI